MFTEIRALRQSADDDHLVYITDPIIYADLSVHVTFVVIFYLLSCHKHSFTPKSIQVLELGMNFLSADDMSAILAVKLRKRLGFGIWAKLHVTGMHVEGKVQNL